MNDTRRSFGLTGPSKMLDRRSHAMRGDLADIALSGKSFAPHYAIPVERMGIVPHSLIHFTPDGENASELLADERFCLLDTSGGWAWGFTAHDHYVGYIKADALGLPTLPAPVDVADDAVTFAQGFLDMPYVWGGRGGAGIDCSGLVQRALAAVGISAPRDSDMQMKALGEALPDDAPLRRGDLIFFPGHVGMMVDATMMIHATMHHGKTVIEPLSTVVARTAEKHAAPVTARKRLSK
jgi:cell wall-associated NlpC family hydrolase